jgi:glycosyl transferase family 87
MRSRSVSLTLAALAALTIAGSLYGNRDRYDRADFRAFYSWWSEYRAGIDPWQPSQVALKTDAPEHPISSFCDNTPGWVVLLSPFGALPERVSYWIWITCQLLALITTVVMLAREIRPPPEPATLLAAAALALLYPPVHVTLHGAQPGMLLLTVVAGAWLCDRKRLPAGAGLMLALGALLKAYPGAVGGYFLFRRRWRALGWAVAFSLAGIALTGVGRWREFLARAPVSSGITLSQPRMLGVWPNVAETLGQLFCPAGGCGLWIPTLAITLTIDLAIICAAAAATVRAPDEGNADGLCFGLWTAVALLLSPMSWDHEMVLLIPIYIFTAGEAARRRDTPRAALVIAIALAASIIPFFVQSLINAHLLFLCTLAVFAAACALAASKPGAVNSRR